MDDREAYFVRNYHIFGKATGKVCGFNQKQSKAIIEKQKEKGVFLLPDKELAKNPILPPDIKGENWGALQFAIASLDPVNQDKIVEIAKNMPSSSVLMDQTIAIQEFRVQLGLKNESEQGKLLDTTEAAISNLVNMIQAKNNIEEGQEVNLNVHSTISSLLDDVEANEKNKTNYENEITIDPVEENKKQQLKEVRSKSISDILDEAKE